MKMNSIIIQNINTYKKLRQIFKGKKPTKHTILIYRLFIEGQINQEEAQILNDYPGLKKATHTGGGFKYLDKLSQQNNLRRLERFS